MLLLLLVGTAIVSAVNDSAELPPSDNQPSWCHACEFPDDHAKHTPSGINCSRNPANQFVEVCHHCGRNCCCVCQQCQNPQKKAAHKFTSEEWCKKFERERNVLEHGEDPPDVLEFEQDGRRSSIHNPKVLNRKPAASKPKPPAPPQNKRKRVRAEEGQGESNTRKRSKTNAKEDCKPTRSRNKRKRVEEQHANMEVDHPEPDPEPEHVYMFRGLPYYVLERYERPWLQRPPRPWQQPTYFPYEREHLRRQITIDRDAVAEFHSAIRARLNKSTESESSNDRLSWAIRFWDLQRGMRTTDLLFAMEEYVQGNVERVSRKQSPQTAMNELTSVLHKAWDTLWRTFVTNYDVIDNGGDAPLYEADLAHVFVQQQIRDSMSWLNHFGPRGSEELNEVPHIRGRRRFYRWYDQMIRFAPEETRFLSCRHWFPPEEENITEHESMLMPQSVPPENTEIPRTASPLASDVQDGLVRPSFADGICRLNEPFVERTNAMRQAKLKEAESKQMEEGHLEAQMEAQPAEEPTEEPAEQPKASTTEVVQASATEYLSGHYPMNQNWQRYQRDQ